MKCPPCGAAMALLFTSSYCPACDKREAKKPAAPTTSEGDRLFVGSDGELWWRRKDGMELRLTSPDSRGPVVAFSLLESEGGNLIGIERMVRSRSVITRPLPADIEPKHWRAP